MPNLKRQSGKDIISSLESIGFSVTRQKGSHVRMSRFSFDTTVRISVPNHDELDKGTQKAIVRALSFSLTEKEIKEIFYTG